MEIYFLKIWLNEYKSKNNHIKIMNILYWKEPSKIILLDSYFVFAKFITEKNLVIRRNQSKYIYY